MIRSPPLLATASRQQTLVKRPREQEHMAVVGVIKHFGQYAAGSTHVAVSYPQP